ncbi:Uncharacterised protein [Acholeplasma hippikon]|uniref:Uncharacterized protein n=1 Tax=Acholeplasma hippikon TaxID=264636 RepID=A0A449BK38_9MOLU|nr:Uncharacterised protein [Acholeplasma hippikon]
MPFQWLFDIVLWIWNNLSWILPFGIFIFFFSLVAPVTRTVRNVQYSFKESITPLGFIVFIILTVFALLVSGLIGNIF